MRYIGIAAVGVFALGFALASFALDKVPTQAELDKIEALRQMIRERGYDWEAGLTSVSHLSEQEFQNLLGLKLPSDIDDRVRKAKEEGRFIEAVEGMAFPASFDWRTQAGVTPVKNQGSCGSCWAFCATAAMESQVLIHTGLEEDLSEQQGIACNTDGYDCSGGWMDAVYDLWITYGAIREECMPYHEVDTDPCIQDSCEIVQTLDGYYYVDETVDGIKTAVLDGPVSCAVTAYADLSTYTGGCYENPGTDPINHGVLIVGWDDNMCGGEGAWIVKNSWGPDWGLNGYFYIKYGSCNIGSYSEALTYTPDQTVHFFYDSHIIDDTAGDGDGFIETAEPIVFAITVLNIAAETATSVSGYLESLTPGVSVVDSLASYPDIPKGETRQSDAPHFSFEVTPSGPSCGPIRFHLVVSSDQGTSHINIVVQAGEVMTVFEDAFETDQGWTAGAPGDDATTGIWERCDPNATWWGDREVQPEDDHTPSPGTQCYVTGQSSPGDSRGVNDVDGGKTTLVSPTIDLSDKDSAVLTYYRWYSSDTGGNPNDDDFVVDVSSDGGSTWHNLETRQSSDPAWRQLEFYLEDYISLTDQVRIRFIAEDNGAGGSIVEAALDDFTIKACQAIPADIEPPEVTVLSPDGGEVWEYGTTEEIQWVATDNVGVRSITILLSTDGGSTFPDTIAAGETNDGSYMWTVPDIDSKTARIKVVALDDVPNEGSDMSDADFTVWGTISGVESPDVAGVPSEVVLDVVSANPTASVSRIVFGIPASAHVKLGIYDVTGRLVRNLVSGYRAKGYHVVYWNQGQRSESRSSPGIYFLRLDCKQGRKIAKIVVAR